MRLHLVLLVGAMAAMAMPEGGSALAAIPPEMTNGTATAPDLPPITEGIIGATSSTSTDASATEPSASASSSSVTPSGNSTNPSASISGAAHLTVPINLARYVGPAAVVVGAVGAGLAVVF